MGQSHYYCGLTNQPVAFYLQEIENRAFFTAGFKWQKLLRHSFAKSANDVYFIKVLYAVQTRLNCSTM